MVARVLKIGEACNCLRGLTLSGTLFQGKVAHVAKVCINLKWCARVGEKGRGSALKPKGLKAPSKRDIFSPQPQLIRRR